MMSRFGSFSQHATKETTEKHPLAALFVPSADSDEFSSAIILETLRPQYFELFLRNQVARKREFCKF